MPVAPPVTELSDRARDIFRRVVDGYLSSGVPVGSRTLAQAGLNLSPASIRSVLAQLEDAGLLAAPHTSAGRMPTDLGLRLFVDGMMHALEPSAEERATIEGRVGRGDPVEQALSATTAALSGLSACAGLVMVPKREQVLRSIGFVPLSNAQALAVLVSEDGERRPVLIVRGQGRLLDDAAAADLERVRELLDDLEGKQEIAALLDSARAGDATRIFIGAETKLFALSGSSVIAKPFRGIDGRVVGVVGVIGPTRLNYARVVPMVDFTAATLARLMG